MLFIGITEHYTNQVIPFLKSQQWFIVEHKKERIKGPGSSCIGLTNNQMSYAMPVDETVLATSQR